MSDRFVVSDQNPNDGIGGGGCLCSPTKCVDCKPPYLIFPATETDNNLSPHAVLSVNCARQGVRAAGKKGNIVTAGESGG